MSAKFKAGDIVFFPGNGSWGNAEVVCSGNAGEYGIKFLDPYNPKTEYSRPRGHSLSGRLTGVDAESGWWVYEENIELWEDDDILLDETQIHKFGNLLEDF